VLLNGDDHQLILWSPETLSPTADTPTGRMLEPIIAQFGQIHPDVFLQIDVKAESGETNILRYLRSAQQNAPSILPDIAVLDTQQLWQLVDLGLVQPLGDDELGYLGDMYPVAVDAVTYQEVSYGLPYAMDLMHLAYDKNSVERLPESWQDLLDAQAAYLLEVGLFPEEGYSPLSKTSMLLLYLGAGGMLTESGTAENADALESVVEFLAQGQEEGVIVRPTEDRPLIESIWSALSTGDFAYANISARSYLDHYEIFDNIGFGTVPMQSGSPQTVARVWAFAILTNDPEQRALALDFIQLLLDPNVQGTWGQFAHCLPSQRQAFETWLNGNEYYEFLYNEIDSAVALPNGPRFVEFSQRIQEAQHALLNGDVTPQEALQKMRSVP